MPVLLLRARADLLAEDLLAVPMRISQYHDLPFAILRYDPTEEWELRRQLTLLENRLQAAGMRTARLSLATLFWEAIETSEGVDAVAELERSRGFEEAERQVATYLSDIDWCHLPSLVVRHIEVMSPTPDVLFLYRAGVMAPAAYHMSKLLDELHGKTRVPIILCYPGSLEPGTTTGLRFMDLDRDATGNYRVKIYG